MLPVSGVSVSTVSSSGGVRKKIFRGASWLIEKKNY